MNEQYGGRSDFDVLVPRLGGARVLEHVRTLWLLDSGLV
jgi:hypothetical protein